MRPETEERLYTCAVPGCPGTEDLTRHKERREESGTHYWAWCPRHEEQYGSGAQ